MNLNTVPAISGWLWFQRGIALFFKNPLAFLGLNAAYLFITTTTALIPVVHIVAPFLILPFFSVLFMTASRAVGAGQPVSRRLLTTVFQTEGRRTLVQHLAILGGCNFAVNGLILVTSSAFDGGALMRIVLFGQPPERAIADGVIPPEMLFALLFLIVCYAPLTVLFWFSPILCAWHRTPPHQALFFSWIACWRNWRAFVVLLFSWIGMFFMTLFTLLMIFSRSAAGSTILSVWFFVSVFLISMFWCSLYTGYAGCFGEAAPI